MDQARNYSFHPRIYRSDAETKIPIVVIIIPDFFFECIVNELDI